MIRTLVLYDGKMSSAQRISSQLSYMIGHTKTAELEEAPEDLSPYGGLCFVFNFYGPVTAEKTRKYLLEHGKMISGKRVVLIGLGFSDQGFTKYVMDLEQETGLAGLSGVFITAQSQATRAGQEIEKIMRAPVNPMEEEALEQAIRKFIESRADLALATAGDHYIRCTPLPYLYSGDSFYIVSEGGSDFRGIVDNGRVSAAIFDSSEKSQGNQVSLTFRGEAGIVSPADEEYTRIMSEGGFDREELMMLPVEMFLIRIRPHRFEFHDPRLALEGYDPDQALDTLYARKNREDGKEYIRKESMKGQPVSTILDKDGSTREVQIPRIREEREDNGPQTLQMPSFLAKEGILSGSSDLQPEKEMKTETMPERAVLSNYAGYTEDAASLLAAELERDIELGRGTARRADSQPAPGNAGDADDDPDAPAESSADPDSDADWYVQPDIKAFTETGREADEERDTKRDLKRDPERTAERKAERRKISGRRRNEEAELRDDSRRERDAASSRRRLPGRRMRSGETESGPEDGRRRSAKEKKAKRGGFLTRIGSLLMLDDDEEI